jgi:hypothetical protein
MEHQARDRALVQNSSTDQGAETAVSPIFHSNCR